jgi:hypothetical protein
MNPCNKCLVTMMCRDSCDDFVGYMRDEIMISTVLPYQSYFDFCQNIRRGSIILFRNKDNDGWRWRTTP